MNLIQLLYCSKSVADINEDDEASILKTSRYNNSNNNVTGALMNNGSYFIQLLEGNYREINDLYNKIVNDPRHERVTLLLYRSAEERIFKDWSMAHIKNENYMNDLLVKYIDSSGVLEIDMFANACITIIKSKAREY